MPTEENKPIDLAELNVAELNEEIDLYIKAGFLPKEDVSLRLKPEKVSWLESQRASYGIPHVITAEDLARPENFKGLDDLKEGDVVLLPLFSDPGTMKPYTVCVTGFTTLDGVNHDAREVVMLDSEDERTKNLLEESIIKASTDVLPMTGDQPSRTDSPSDAPIETSKEVEKLLPPRYIYQGKLVKSFSDKLMHGKVYVEVHTEGETFLLSPAEFSSDVTIAQSND